jgi:hypothetical protein
MKVLFAAAAMLHIAVPAFAQDNTAVNAVYDRMSAAYATRDRTLLGDVFHPQMVTSSAIADQPAVIGGKALTELVGAGFDRLKQGDRQAELSFRITHRGWAGETAVDVGVLRMRYRGGDREDRTVYSRYLSTLTRRDDGLWVFLTDSPASASAANWDNATPFAGARFDP